MGSASSMEFKTNKLVWGLTTFLLAASCFAQSPPLGPPRIVVDKFDVSASVLAGYVQTAVQGILTSTNASLQQQGHSARVSELPLQSWPPYMLPTQYSNRPNEWYVNFPLIVGIEVHIPDYFDRQVYIPLDLKASCEGWATGAGVIQVISAPGPPSFEGGSWLEAAPGLSFIRDAIDSALRGSFGVPPETQQLLALDKCIALGVLSGPTLNESAVLFDRPSNGHQPPIVTALTPSLEVNFLKLKRLVAHIPGDGVLYNEVESIILEPYVNYTSRATAPLTMRENDEVALTLLPVIFKPPILDLLVVIANIDQQSQSNVQDSAFGASYRSMNFSPGTHTLDIPKTYAVPAGPGPAHNKPIISTMPAYELTYTISYHGPPVILAPTALTH